jgi:hypothetical protein
MSMKTVTPTHGGGRRTPTLLWLMLIVVGLALLVVIPFGTWLFQQDLPPFNVTIDGTEYVRSIDLGGLAISHKLAVIVAVFAAVVALLIAVPVLIASVLAAVAIAVVFGVGVPLIVAAVMVVIALSPILLLLALASWLWRSSTRRSPGSAGVPVL